MEKPLKETELYDAMPDLLPQTGDLDLSFAWLSAAEKGNNAGSAGENEGKILTSTLWNQEGTVYVWSNNTQTPLPDYTYNQYCPNASSSDTSKSLTGCTNTADSQILYYWIEKKGYTNLAFTLNTGDYFYLYADNGEKAYYISDTANVGEGTLSAMNSALATSNRVGNGNFIAALNFYCGVKNHAIYGKNETSTIFYYGAYTNGTNAAAYQSAGFDSYYSISRTGGASATKIFFGSKGLTDVGYSIIRENLDYGEVIRVNVPGHAIYMDGYRLTSSGYEYHLNYGWGINAADTRWYTEAELSTTDSTNLFGYITGVIIDLSPNITVNVTSARGDYYGGSFLRGIERINHIQNDKSTTFSFDSAIAGSMIALSSSAVISSDVDVAFTHLNAALSTTTKTLISSSRAMTFELSGGSLAVNSTSALAVVNETGKSAVSLSLNDSYIYSGYYSDGVTALDALLNRSGGYSYGEYAESFYQSIRGHAVKSGAGDDVVSLSSGSAVYGKLDLGGGGNVLNLESGSLFCGSFTGSANTLTANLTVNSANYTGPLIVVRDTSSTSALHSATGGVLNLTLSADALQPQVYNLVYGGSASLMQNFSVSLKAPGVSATLSYSNPRAGNYTLTFNDEKLGLLYQPENVDPGKVNVYYGAYLVNAADSLSDISVGSGLRMEVLADGQATSITVKASGLMEVYSGGSVDSSEIGSGGTVNLLSGSRAVGMTVVGTLTVTGNASAADTRVSSGGKVLVEAGGELNGTLFIAEGATVSVAKGGSVVMDIRQAGTESSNALIKNINLITGTPNFTVQASETQFLDESPHRYILATGASGFTSTLTISTEQREIGRMSSNTSLYAHGFTCSLNTSAAGELSLTMAHSSAAAAIQHAGTVGQNKLYSETLLLKTDYSGRYNLYGNFGILNGSIAIYNGRKCIGSAKIRNGAFLFNGGRTVLLDNTVQYSIVVKNTDRGKTASDFNYTVQGVSMYWKALHEKDTPDASPAVVVQQPGDEISVGWIGFSDAMDYQKFTLDSAAKLGLTVSVSDHARVKIYNSSMKQIQSTVIKAGGLMLDRNLKTLLLNAGTYYLSVESMNAARGGGTDYKVAVNADSRFFTAADNSNDTIQQAAQKNAVLAGEEITGWVGFSDAADYIKLQVDQTGRISLDLDAVTATAYASKQLKFTCRNEAGKTVALTSFDADTLLSRKTVEAGIYYLGVTCANVKKYDTAYSVTTGLLAG